MAISVGERFAALFGVPEFVVPHLACFVSERETTRLALERGSKGVFPVIQYVVQPSVLIAGHVPSGVISRRFIGVKRKL